MAIAVLSGCSRGETANETLPEASPSAAETSEALPPLGPPDLPMPPEAREQTEAGAAAFIRYYVELINHTNSDMDPQFLRQLSRDCATCDRIADETDADALAGYRYVGGRLSVTSSLEATLSTPGQAESAFVIDQEELAIENSNGQPVPGLSFPALDDLQSGSVLTWNKGIASWMVTELTLG
ncbi:DUF6318 family protein [Modestobacter sp. VKM Ac-2977]|uniref:DUF6318 family protein n=1 Tax=Modestobacter sp. VKM Ac-2977 TaxID=3004131 RepID=UPI0022AA1730|nr:DUF6318 family protein [Modestobacter sp. VKM Ac-2977]MCZ2818734.1 DUF6318 family protein [Modestobacter sp. VKM Ac-2977]